MQATYLQALRVASILHMLQLLRPMKTINFILLAAQAGVADVSKVDSQQLAHHFPFSDPTHWSLLCWPSRSQSQSRTWASLRQKCDGTVETEAV
jgi:hypothetical protein